MKRNNQEKPPEDTTSAEPPAQPSAQKHEANNSPGSEQRESREKELLDQLQRLQAEFENYRKRVESETERTSERKAEQLLKELLPIADSLALFSKHYGEAKGTSSEISQGIALIRGQLDHVLEHWGVSPLVPSGKVDPRLHEVYATETITETTGGQDGEILDVIQNGYVRHGAVLRTAKVKAARKEKA